MLDKIISGKFECRYKSMDCAWYGDVDTFNIPLSLDNAKGNQQNNAVMKNSFDSIISNIENIDLENIICIYKKQHEEIK